MATGRWGASSGRGSRRMSASKSQPELGSGLGMFHVEQTSGREDPANGGGVPRGTLARSAKVQVRALLGPSP
jgi:hypothetical protein